MPAIRESLIRSRSGGLVAALTFSTLATGLLQICLPLELRQLRATPNEIGLTLSMFGFGMFAFEWLWGVLADRVGYRGQLPAGLGNDGRGRPDRAFLPRHSSACAAARDRACAALGAVGDRRG